MAVKISTRELEDERKINPTAKAAVNRAMRPRIIDIVWILERTVIAIIGRRQATTVENMDEMRIIHDSEYSVISSSSERQEDWEVDGYEFSVFGRVDSDRCQTGIERRNCSHFFQYRFKCF